MQAEKFHDLPLEDVLGDRFARYSKYIIQDRALPDARDGLKPVQRRILYSMYVEGNVHDKAFRKSAKTVGNVIGNYHPHGDSSVYEAMVRLSQTWKVRNVLVEMHGNNGSVDGDPAARCVIRKLVYHQSHLNYYVILIKKQLNSCQTLMIRVKNRLYYQHVPEFISERIYRDFRWLCNRNSSASSWKLLMLQ